MQVTCQKAGGGLHTFGQYLKEKNKITVSLIEAKDEVDTGDIWAQKEITYEGHELIDEINDKLFMAELDLMTMLIKDFKALSPVKQVDLLVNISERERLKIQR